MKVKLDNKPMFHNALSKSFAHAKENRENQTVAERLLWDTLKGKALGHRFRREHPLGQFILDFYCHAASLGVEVDGGYHTTKEQLAKDEGRTAYLQEKGISIIRFTNEEVISNLAGVLTEIETEVARRLPLGNQRVRRR